MLAAELQILGTHVADTVGNLSISLFPAVGNAPPTIRKMALITLAILGLGVMPFGRCDGFFAIPSVLKLGNPPRMIMLGKASIIQGVTRCRRQRAAGVPGCEGSSFIPSRPFPDPPVETQSSTPRRCTARMCLGSHTGEKGDENVHVMIPFSSGKV